MLKQYSTDRDASGITISLLEEELPGSFSCYSVHDYLGISFSYKLKSSCQSLSIHAVVTRSRTRKKRTDLRVRGYKYKYFTLKFEPRLTLFPISFDCRRCNNNVIIIISPIEVMLISGVITPMINMTSIGVIEHDYRGGWAMAVEL